MNLAGEAAVDYPALSGIRVIPLGVRVGVEMGRFHDTSCDPEDGPCGGAMGGFSRSAGRNHCDGKLPNLPERFTALPLDELTS